MELKRHGGAPLSRQLDRQGTNVGGKVVKLTTQHGPTVRS